MFLDLCMKKTIKNLSELRVTGQLTDKRGSLVNEALECCDNRMRVILNLDNPEIGNPSMQKLLDGISAEVLDGLPVGKGDLDCEQGRCSGSVPGSQSRRIPDRRQFRPERASSIAQVSCHLSIKQTTTVGSAGDGR